MTFRPCVGSSLHTSTCSAVGFSMRHFSNFFVVRKHLNQLNRFFCNTYSTCSSEKIRIPNTCTLPLLTSQFPSAFIHPSAVLIGRVDLGRDVSIWPGVVIRGDVNRVTIDDETNIQDGTVIHVTGDWSGENSGAPTTVGKRVSVGHMALLHGCTIADDVLVGMNTTIMDKAVVPSWTVIGAGSLVGPGKVLDGYGLYVGRPAKRVRDLRPDELEWIKNNAARYLQLKKLYASTKN